MAVHHIASTEENWTQKLASLLDESQEGDILVCSDHDMLDLAKNALKRRVDHKYLRVMTGETYARINERS